MNIEESIKILKELKKNEWGELLNCWDYGAEESEAIEILLTAYEKEKEKNKNAIKYIKEISPLEVGRAPDGKMMYDHNLNQDEIYGLLEILEEE